MTAERTSEALCILLPARLATIIVWPKDVHKPATSKLTRTCIIREQFDNFSLASSCTAQVLCILRLDYCVTVDMEVTCDSLHVKQRHVIEKDEG
jgi:hypothetical protein